MSRIRIGAALGALVLAATTIGPAAASDLGPGKPPAGWIVDPGLYELFFGSAGEWAPQGSVVADSGFRPYPNGFGFTNYGADFDLNALLFGIPFRISPSGPAADASQPQRLNSLAMRRTYGDTVCIDPKAINPRTGACRMTLSAEIFAAAMTAPAGGGHCFGMAAAAAALYNGQIPPNQLGSGLVPALNPLNGPAQQTILRLFGTQIFNAAERMPSAPTPTAVVQTLIADFADGTVPYILVLDGPNGHAITPYAVLDRGNGQYDIAVYDNNFPHQPRAVQVDTITDTFRYSGGSIPGQDPYIYSEANDNILGLIEVNRTLEQQPCWVCRDQESPYKIIAFSPVASDNAGLALTVVGLDGKPLPPGAVEAFQPLNPPGPQFTSLPFFLVRSDTSFQLIVDTRKMNKQQSLEVYGVGNGATRFTVLENIEPGTLERFIYNARTDQITVQANRPTAPRLVATVDEPGESFLLNGQVLNLPRQVRFDSDLDRNKKVMKYRTNAKRPTTWIMQIDRVTGTTARGFIALEVDVPRNATVVLDYGSWNDKRGPKVWVDRGSDGTLDDEVPVQQITKALVDELERRGLVYTAQGV
jgi:hypothetical protein